MNVIHVCYSEGGQGAVTTTYQPLHRFFYLDSCTFTESREVSIENMRRMMHASMDHLPFRIPSFDHFGTTLYSIF